MLIKSKIILLIISFHAVLGWSSPDRCKQGRFQRSTDQLNSNLKTAPVINNITEVASNQNKYLNQTYNDAKFFGVPTGGRIIDLDSYEIYVPNSCKFYTYKPRLLTSVYCQNSIACKLVHSVATTRSYTSSDGYNWGAKISGKGKVIGIEIGGEVSGGGTYSCTYNVGKTTTDTVECSVPAGSGQTLQLYNVQSDMECQFSTVAMVSDERDGYSAPFAHDHFFTNDDKQMLKDEAILNLRNLRVLPNLDKMSDQLLKKIKRKFRYYNPYTDIVQIVDDMNAVSYYKEGTITAGPKKVIPFTNEAGDSIYQYACVLT